MQTGRRGIKKLVRPKAKISTPFVRCRIGHRDLYAVCELRLEFGGLAVWANDDGVSLKDLATTLMCRYEAQLRSEAAMGEAFFSSWLVFAQRFDKRTF